MRGSRKIAVVLTAVALLASCGGTTARGPYQSNGEHERDPNKAAGIYREAVALLDTDPTEAEALLRQALGYDLYHGAAHNNLGVLLLNQGKLYDAAEEFEWARKLLPGNPEPRVNLAMVLTKAGKHQDAVNVAKTALEVQPGNLQAAQTIAYIQVRNGVTDDTTKGHLERIVFQATEAAWAEWAKVQLVKLGAGNG